MRNLKRSIFLLAALGLPACAPSEPSHYLALVGGTVIDGTGAAPHQGWTVLIRDSLIAAVGPELEVPSGAEIRDISDYTVVPGLIDMHGHMYALRENQFTAYPSLYLAGGVTTVFSPGDFDPEGMTALRDQVARGEVAGPRILTAGPYFDTYPSAVPWIGGVRSLEEARALVTEWKDRIDAVKVYSSATEELITFLVEQAHAAGLKVTGHLGGPTTTLRAIELGIDGLEHGIFAVAEIGDVPQYGPINERYCSLAEVNLDSPAVDSLIDAIVEEGVWVTPTIVALAAIHPDFQPPTPDAVVYLSEDFRSRMEAMPAYLNDVGAECLDRALEVQLEFVRRVHERNGLVVTGTDPVSPLLTPGYALHAEMKYLVEAGLTPLEAISAATRNGAVALGLLNEIGIIQPGHRADLAVVRGDPATDIAAIGNTVVVFKDGIRYDPQALRDGVKGKIGPPTG
jgi:imidazolonepropionase-like amidohydrolase